MQGFIELYSSFAIRAREHKANCELWGPEGRAWRDCGALSRSVCGGCLLGGEEGVFLAVGDFAASDDLAAGHGLDGVDVVAGRA